MVHTLMRLVGFAVACSVVGCSASADEGESASALRDDLDDPSGGTSTGACVERKLVFSADELPNVPAAGAGWVWGGNATGGEDVLYSDDFMAHAQRAHANRHEVFAYLEGPCGDTGGVDDGERGRCEGIHRRFNERYAPNTPDTAEERWKPYTFKQLALSSRAGADYCEIDNLSNNVTVPLNPLLREIKALYDAGRVHCRLVLKNVEATDIDAIRQEVAPTPNDARFIAPFHIFEADDGSAKAELDAAMVRLKGRGAVAIISTDTDAYGSAFTNDRFLTCQ